MATPSAMHVAKSGRHVHALNLAEKSLPTSSLRDRGVPVHGARYPKLPRLLGIFSLLPSSLTPSPKRHVLRDDGSPGTFGMMGLLSLSRPTTLTLPSKRHVPGVDGFPGIFDLLSLCGFSGPTARTPLTKRQPLIIELLPQDALDT